MKICLVGPLPPPSGGMANQCQQLLRLLQAEGLAVELVRTNAPYQPAWMERVPVLRAGARLLPYLWRLWTAIGRADVIHVLANSGWAWHLFAAPALALARWRSRPVVLNYRGGEAAAFFARAPRHVLRSLRGVALRVTPSDYLRRVFAQHGLEVQVIPNILDPGRFQPQPLRDFGDAPQILIARNLEPIYGLDVAIKAFVQVRQRYPAARLCVAGSGPQEAELRALVQRLGLSEAVEFPGRVDHANMPALYARSDLALNPSRVDNMPNAVLEAFASGVPVVSTVAGGVPDICTHEREGLLAPVDDVDALAAAQLRLLGDGALRSRMREAALQRAEAWSWPVVRAQWLAAYRQAISQGAG